MFDNYFERVAVITLDESSQRQQRLVKRLEALDLKCKINWVRAIPGKLLTPPKWWNAGKSPWGCYLSHLKVCQDAIRDKIAHYLVLEDDVIFQSESKEWLHAFMSQVPSDWGQIYLGGQHLRPPSIVPGLPFVLRGANINRTHAFALHANSMRDFYKHAWDIRNFVLHPSGWHIDHHLGTAHEEQKWPVYAPMIWIAGQDESVSTISGSSNPQYWWHPELWAEALPILLIKSEDQIKDHNLLDYLYFDHDSKTNSLESKALDEILEDVDRLKSWLKKLAKCALDQEKLPAIQHPFISAEMLIAITKSPVLCWDCNTYRQIHSETYERIRTTIKTLFLSGRE